MKLVLPVLLATAVTRTCALPQHVGMPPDLEDSDMSDKAEPDYDELIHAAIPEVKQACGDNRVLPHILSDSCIKVLKSSIDTLKKSEDDYNKVTWSHMRDKVPEMIPDLDIWFAAWGRKDQLWDDIERTVSWAVTSHIGDSDKIPDSEANLEMLAGLQSDLITLVKVRRKRPFHAPAVMPGGNGTEKKDMVIDPYNDGKDLDYTLPGPEQVDDIIPTAVPSKDLPTPVCDEACHIQDYISTAGTKLAKDSEHLRDLLSGVRQIAEILPVAQAALGDLLEYSDKYKKASGPITFDFVMNLPLAYHLVDQIEELMNMARLDSGHGWVEAHIAILDGMDQDLQHLYGTRTWIPRETFGEKPKKSVENTRPWLSSCDTVCQIRRSAMEMAGQLDRFSHSLEITCTDKHEREDCLKLAHDALAKLSEFSHLYEDHIEVELSAEIFASADEALQAVYEMLSEAQVDNSIDGWTTGYTEELLEVSDQFNRLQETKAWSSQDHEQENSSGPSIAIGAWVAIGIGLLILVLLVLLLIRVGYYRKGRAANDPYTYELVENMTEDDEFLVSAKTRGGP